MEWLTAYSLDHIVLQLKNSYGKTVEVLNFENHIFKAGISLQVISGVSLEPNNQVFIVKLIIKDLYFSRSDTSSTLKIWNLTVGSWQERKFCTSIQCMQSLKQTKCRKSQAKDESIYNLLHQVFCDLLITKIITYFIYYKEKTWW